MLEGLGVEVVEGSVMDPVALRRLLRDIDVVYHLAGIISVDGDPDGRIAAVNVGGTRNVIDAAVECGVRRFVHVSSIHAFDLIRREGPIDETSARVGNGHPAYDRSKNAGEREVRNGIQRGIEAVILNPTGVIGPLDYRPSLVGRSLLDMFNRRLPAVIEGGFDWVDVRDVALGVVAAAERGRPGANYILAGGWRSVADVAVTAARVSGVAAPRFSVSVRFARSCVPLIRLVGRFVDLPPVTAESLLALAANPEVSSALARAELGFTTRTAEESIADAFACFFKRGLLAGAAPAS